MTEAEREIAAVAARMVVEEGLGFGAAKQRALKEMGLSSRTPLPSNEVVEDQVRDYLALFCADTQPAELRALRQHARGWMNRLAPFRPLLGGAVWQGWATRRSDIELSVFSDDPKALEIELINHHQSYEVHAARGMHGEAVPVLSLHSFCRELNEDIGVHLRVYDGTGLRGALLPDARGRKLRGDIEALDRLLAADAGQ